MPKIKGKEQLCVCSNYRKNFKSFQGFKGYTLFDRYPDLENIINKKIDKKYRGFLAQPIIEDNDIIWFSVPYSETPERFSNIDGEKKAKYRRIKENTVNHYKDVIDQLKQQKKTSEAECLENAIKFINDDFLYCYDDNVILGIWGMQLRDDIREPLGIAMKNHFSKNRKKRTEPDDTEQYVVENELDNHESEDPEFPEQDSEQEPDSEVLDSKDTESEPEPEISESKNPELEAEPEIDQESEPEPEVPESKNPEPLTETNLVHVTGPNVVSTEGNWSMTGKGCLNWLLLALLLALIFMIIWCFLIKGCNFNFCGCESEEYDTIVVKPTPTPIEPVKPAPKPVVVECNGMVKSGGFEEFIANCEMGIQSGSFVFDYETYTQPDRITIYDGPNKNGNVIFSYEGGTKGQKSSNVFFHESIITIEVVGGSSGTSWNFEINCP